MKRVEGDQVKRGVVFINQTVPYKLVAWLANKLYKEHYIAIPTKNALEITYLSKNIWYPWIININWNHIAVHAAKENEPMLPGSAEKFIFELYYGSTKISSQLSQEYKVNHLRRQMNKVLDYSINCDFKSLYGNDSACLCNHQPDSVIIQKGHPLQSNENKLRFK
jgi:hypothetical protein